MPVGTTSSQRHFHVPYSRRCLSKHLSTFISAAYTYIDTLQATVIPPCAVKLNCPFKIHSGLLKALPSLPIKSMTCSRNIKHSVIESLTVIRWPYSQQYTCAIHAHLGKLRRKHVCLSGFSHQLSPGLILPRCACSICRD